MTLYSEHTGNLFDSTADAIGHGVNTHGVMGAGIAVAFKQNFVGLYDTYKLMCQYDQLSPGEVFVWKPFGVAGKPYPEYIYNIASQALPGANARWRWLGSGLLRAVEHAEDHQVQTIALPRIGCGIGGLDWESVKNLIKDVAESTSVDIEVWSL